ncbi:uncharacterized protein LOC127257872 isoform X2 [Andrographis paniculata]|uniref:uncharacterized protein LOC127257872 isoform X2 n=1 Tax=Andrographis paniculata TaxID=175694 RepID=UPI0021E918BD|nr:uncharacterized protein LOC127257872 isoform X2 [Andrographis paniculata]
MDAVQPQKDNEYTFVLELAETDPFYEKKKQKDFLNAFLQCARIIKLNEVELYFASDASNTMESCSPGNELEALNSILEAIDKSTSGETMKDTQQNLRDAIINRIHEVGSTFGEEKKILEDPNSDKEKCLLDWGIHNGVKTKLDIAHVEGAGRGAIAKEDMKIGDIALEIPISVIISGDLLYKSDMFPILEKIDGISEETMLLLWSMKEKYNSNSDFKLYFDTLPEKFNTGLSFGIDAVMALDGTLLLDEIVQAKEHLRSQYDELFPALSKHYPDVFPPHLYTWEQFLWACELWYSNSMKLIFDDGKIKTCLVPIAGFLNHSICPHITQYGKIDTSTNSLKFIVSRPCRTGEQCFLGYGKFSSSHLLTFYGFLPKRENPYDVISLDIDEDAEDGAPAPEWSSHMVRGTWLSRNHGIFHYGLPAPLLDHLRRARNPTWQSNNPTREMLETDLDLLRDLSSTFEAMIEAFGEENPENSEGAAGWDVKLAMEFKILQRRIVSSILASCESGCKLLDSALN